MFRYAVLLACNVSGAWRRAGFHKGSDGRRTPKFLRSVARDNAPPDAKPLVGRRQGQYSGNLKKLTLDI